VRRTGRRTAWASVCHTQNVSIKLALEDWGSGRCLGLAEWMECRAGGGGGSGNGVGIMYNWPQLVVDCKSAPAGDTLCVCVCVSFPIKEHLGPVAVRP